jgi:hypothetical protein
MLTNVVMHVAVIVRGWTEIISYYNELVFLITVLNLVREKIYLLVLFDAAVDCLNSALPLSRFEHLGENIET